MRTSFLAILIFAVAIGVSAQEPPVRMIQPHTLSVNAEGQYQAEPDVAVIGFTVSAAEKSAKVAYDRAARGVDQVRETLRAVGIDPSAARFGFFSLSPSYEFKSNKRKIVQFVATTKVQVRLKQFDKVGALLDQLSNLDVTGDQTLEYIVENTEVAKAKAVQDGMSRARAEAEAIARTGNRTLGELVWASVDTQERVRPWVSGRSYQSQIQMAPGARQEPVGPPPSEGFTPGPVTITAKVEALFALK